MEFSQAVRSRRMTRRFDPDREVPYPVLAAALRHALRAPSAGFSQGWDFVVLTRAHDRARFWAAAGRRGDTDDEWLRGVRAAPALVVCCSDPNTYLARYAESDKAGADLARSGWPAPYWDIDVGMAALLILLTAADHGLGALFFGVPAAAHDRVRAALSLPGDRRLVGVVALGHPAAEAGRPTRRRRCAAEVVHDGRFGVPWSGQERADDGSSSPARPDAD
jgi:nitroreductase